MDSKVRKLMLEVRNWAENNRYNLCRRGYDRELCGMCGVASARLMEVLENAGYKPTIGIADDSEYDFAHCFVLLEDYVLDVTATQFGLDKIIIMHQKEAERYWFWQVKEELYSVEQLLVHQKRNGWPSYQLATPEKFRYNMDTIH